MKHPSAIILLFTILSLGFTGCNRTTNPLKMHPSDPFAKTIVHSDFFEINNSTDTIIEGKQGTVVIIPKNCFKNKNGVPTEGKVKIELAEALSVEEMILSNLTTTSDGNLLETDGMIYLNATANGEQLAIDKHNPIHVDIPTQTKKPGMMVYKGIRDENGNMNWINPVEPETYLVTVDMNTLDFLPENFRQAVDAGIPFRTYQENSTALTDSLYYSLNPNSPAMAAQVENAAINTTDHLQEGSEHTQSIADHGITNCGIEPAAIRAIRSAKYAHTFIATREFESRLRVIFKTCNTEILNLYINNLDKNLYEIDNMVAALLGSDSEYGKVFLNFANQKLTKVKDADFYASALKGYYQQQLERFTNETDSIRKIYEEEKEKESLKAAKLEEEYQLLLHKREKYRMETYGFTMTESGWVNIDNGILPKSWGSGQLEVTIENNTPFDRIYTYVLYSSIKSLYRLNSSDNKIFYAGNQSDKSTLMPKNQLAVIVAIGYKHDSVFVGIKEFTTVTTTKLSLLLSKSDLVSFKETIKQYDSYGEENDINKDLFFMDAFNKTEQKRKQQLLEYQFAETLKNTAFPCCKNLDGYVLFMNNCVACHSIDEKIVGPPLANATKKHPQSWLIKWTRDAPKLISEKDPRALNIYREYNESVHSTFYQLDDEQINAIYAYIDRETNKK